MPLYSHHYNITPHCTVPDITPNTKYNSITRVEKKITDTGYYTKLYIPNTVLYSKRRKLVVYEPGLYEYSSY